MEGGIGVIAQTIQLALAPVFVLVAIGNIMNILSTRLGRIVDRSRYLVERHPTTSGAEHDAIVREIRLVDRNFAAIDLKLYVATTFILAIGLLMAGLLLFLRETREAAAALRIPETYLELERKL